MSEDLQPEGLWEGDRGTLAAPLRDVLAQLISGPYVTATKKVELWQTLITHEALIRSRLHDLYLELMLDRQMGVAFAQNVSVPDRDDIPGLMRTDKLTHLATMLLVHLRQQHMQAVANGEDAYLGQSEISDYLAPYLRSTGVSDDVKQQKQITSAMNAMARYSLLKRVKDTDRYRIQDIVALIVSPERARELQAQYETICAEGASEEGGTDDGEERGDE